MRKLIVLSVILPLTAACGSTANDRALTGGLLGAGAGAIIGGVATGTSGGALAGAAIGGVGGAVIGSATAPRYCYAYNRYGNRIRVRC